MSEQWTFKASFKSRDTVFLFGLTVILFRTRPVKRIVVQDRAAHQTGVEARDLLNVGLVGLAAITTWYISGSRRLFGIFVRSHDMEVR